jgi:hypothetical protein
MYTPSPSLYITKTKALNFDDLASKQKQATLSKITAKYYHHFTVIKNRSLQNRFHLAFY